MRSSGPHLSLIPCHTLGRFDVPVAFHQVMLRALEECRLFRELDFPTGSSMGCVPVVGPRCLHSCSATTPRPPRLLAPRIGRATAEARLMKVKSVRKQRPLYSSHAEMQRPPRSHGIPRNMLPQTGNILAAVNRHHVGRPGSSLRSWRAWRFNCTFWISPGKLGEAVRRISDRGLRLSRLGGTGNSLRSLR